MSAAALSRPSLRLAVNTRVLTAGLGVAVFLYLLSDLNRRLNVYDEGWAVYNALRVAHGEVPYRDFWVMYAPGQFYVLAGLFKLFGESILVARLWDVLVRFALSIVVYRLTGTLASPVVARVVWVIVAVALIPGGLDFYYGYAMYPALLGSLGSVLGLLRYSATGRPRWLLLAGLAVGATTLFRHDFGAYTFVADSLALLIFAPGQAAGAGAAWRDRLRSLGGLALGTAAVAVPPALVFLALVPLETLWRDFFVIPATVLRTVYVLPIPPLLPAAGFDLPAWLAFYFPLLLGGAAAALLVFTRQQDWPDRTQRLGILALIALGGLLFLQVFSRNESIHRLPTALAAIILGAVVLTALLPRVRLRLSRAIIVAALAIIGLYYVGLPLIFQLRIVEASANPDCASTLPRSGCIRLDPGQRQAVEYIQAHTPPDTPLYVGLPHHDQVAVNDAMFYFLADRPSATAYHTLMPDVTTTAPAQAQMVAALTRRPVPYVVLWAGAAVWDEPNGTSVSSGITILDDYLAQRYQPVARFGDYTILRAR
jgi:hypothetical protein